MEPFHVSVSIKSPKLLSVHQEGTSYFPEMSPRLHHAYCVQSVLKKTQKHFRVAGWFLKVLTQIKKNLTFLNLLHQMLEVSNLLADTHTHTLLPFSARSSLVVWWSSV